jgi:hypothetical protein
MVKKQKLTYFQQHAQKKIDKLLEEYKKTGKKFPAEQFALVVYSPIFVDCLNDLDTRLKKLEQKEK